MKTERLVTLAERLGNYIEGGDWHAAEILSSHLHRFAAAQASLRTAESEVEGAEIALENLVNTPPADWVRA